MRPKSVGVRMTFFCRIRGILQHAVIAVSLGLLLVSCVGAPSPSTRLLDAQALAVQNGWIQRIIPGGGFDLSVFHPSDFRPGGPLTIYIEGDGFAWQTGRTPSQDPSPINPLALKLALAHPNGNAAYLARPCQYMVGTEAKCSQRYWTFARFAPEVVDSMNNGVSQLKATFRAQSLTLVGYSGGAAIAALIAARRDDVIELITVAGNLDHAAWTSYHNLLPLTGSLNAADVSAKLIGVKQRHFLGRQDSIIPPVLGNLWPPELRGAQDSNLRIIDGFDHACCWERDWAVLVARQKQ